jgi:quinol monooxygenase YgiN
MTVTLLVRNRITSFDEWKKVFDALGPTRRQHGCLRTTVYQDARDPKLVVVLTEMEDMAAARRWASSTELVDGMARAGVTQAPEIEFLNAMDTQTY